MDSHVTLTAPHRSSCGALAFFEGGTDAAHRPNAMNKQDIAKPKFVQLKDGGRLSYQVLGNPAATAVLLLRPLGGSVASWGEFATTVAEKAFVISFDPRGVGASSDAPWFHSARAMARDAVELLEHLQIRSVAIFGQSMGALVASWMAFDAPARVQCLMLASVVPPINLRTFSLRRAKTDMSMWWRALRSKEGTTALSLHENLPCGDFRDVHPERFAEIEDQVRSTPLKFRNLLIRGVAGRIGAIDRQLTGFSKPILLLFGDCDPLVSQKMRNRLAGTLPSARVQTLTKTGHDLSLEQPQELALQVLAFLEENRIAREKRLALDTSRWEDEGGAPASRPFKTQNHETRSA